MLDWKYSNEGTALNGTDQNGSLEYSDDDEDEDDVLSDLPQRPTFRRLGRSIGGSITTSTRSVLEMKKGFSSGFHSFMESWGGLQIAFACLAVYYTAAIIAYSHVFERWSYIDSMYFATVTFTTIGYGDITPTTDSSRLFTVFFSMSGVFILGFFAGIFGEKIVELQLTANENMQDQARNDFRKKFGMEPKKNIVKREPNSVFYLTWKALKVELPLLSVLFFIGIVYGTTMEQWNIIESIYFSTITFSTVGFGDYFPSHEWTRLAFIFLLPAMVAIFCEMLGRVASAYLQYKLHLQEEEFLNRQFTLADLDKMDMNHNGQVSYGEFLHFMLIAMQKVEEEDLEELRAVFDKFDVNKDGTLSKGDLAGFVNKRALRSMGKSCVF